jgi:molybdopterin molybdotransferase
VSAGPAAGREKFPAADWLGWREALDQILSRCEALPTERVEAAGALGAAVAEDVKAAVFHPPWDNSAMDGFAVHAEDVRGATADNPITLPVSDDIPAGCFPSGPLPRGTVARIMTGAPVPEGATGVVRVEHTDDSRNGEITFFQESDAKRNIRRRGEDIQAGDTVLRVGDPVTPAAIGVLAMQGMRNLVVRRRPRVGVMSNGNELADFDEVAEVRAGRRIMNSNGHALAAQLVTAGAEPVMLGIARDDADDVRRRLERAADCDAVISSAGVSVGDHDQVKAALDDMGMQRVFWRVRIRPGSPLTFGLLGGRPFWGLPGNPVSAMVTFEVFLRPAIRKMAGHREPEVPRIRARARKAISSSADLTHFYRVTLSRVAGDLPEVELTGPQGSGILTSMSAADGLLVVPEGVSEIPAGAIVDVIPIPGDWL